MKHTCVLRNKEMFEKGNNEMKTKNYRKYLRTVRALRHFDIVAHRDHSLGCRDMSKWTRLREIEKRAERLSRIAGAKPFNTLRW